MLFGVLNIDGGAKSASSIVESLSNTPMANKRSLGYPCYLVSVLGLMAGLSQCRRPLLSTSLSNTSVANKRSLGCPCYLVFSLGLLLPCFKGMLSQGSLGFTLVTSYSSFSSLFSTISSIGLWVTQRRDFFLLLKFGAAS